MKTIIYILILVLGLVACAFGGDVYEDDDVSGDNHIVFNYDQNITAPFHVMVYHWDNTLGNNDYTLDKNYYSVEEMRITDKEVFYNVIRPYLLEHHVEYLYPSPNQVWQMFSDKYVPSQLIIKEFNEIVAQLPVGDYQERNATTDKLRDSKFTVLINTVNTEELDPEAEQRILYLRKVIVKLSQDQVKVLFSDKLYLKDALAHADNDLKVLIQKRIDEIKN